MSSVINAIYRNITLDLYTVGSAVTVTAMQADTLSRYIRVTLTNNGSDYEIDEDAHPQIFIVKSDGRIVYNNGTVDDGALLFELDNQMLAAPGKCKTQILLWDRDYEQVLRNATPLFIDVIEKVDEESAVASTSEYGVLEDILQAIEEGGYITDNNFTNAYKDKLDGIETGAEANQNAISQVVADGTTVYSEEKTSSIEIAGSDGITVSGDNTSKLITIGVDGEELASALPTASATQAGILTAEDYARFGNGGGGGGVSISQVTETDITLTTPSAVDYKVPRADGDSPFTFDAVYPVGSLFVTNQRGGYPSVGTWQVFDVALAPYFTTIEYDNGNSWAINEGGHSVHHVLIRTVPNTITGECDGEAHYIGALACQTARLTTIADEPVYVSGFIYADEETVPHAALFRVDPGSYAGIYIERWTGSLIADSKAYFNFTSVANRYTILSGTTSTIYEIVTYKRVS